MLISDLPSWREPDFIPNLNGSVHSLEFHDVNSDYDQPYSNVVSKQKEDVKVIKKPKLWKDKDKRIKNQESTEISINNKDYVLDKNS